MSSMAGVRMRLAALAIVFAVQGLTLAEEPVKPTAPPTVLDTYSYWRSFVTFRPIVLAERAEAATVPEGRPWTVAPPDDWRSPDFEDGDWVRTTGPLFAGPGGLGWVRDGGGAREISVLCLRGKFAVADPAKVESLRLSAAYRGGIVVYLNGIEAARAHMGKGPLTPESLAEEYPWEAYVDADGRTPLEPQGARRSDEQTRRLKLRLRHIQGVPIPTAGLRRGVNVLAIEIHRAPTHPQAEKLRDAWKAAWSTCGLCDIALTAEPQSAVQPNTQRPKGIQVWNESPLSDLYEHDYGDPNERLRPMQLVGVRNGAFSGHVVVGSDSPIKGLAAEVSDLVTGDGKGRIPAAAVRLLYPQPTGLGPRASKSYRGLSGRAVRRFDALAESPPIEVAVAPVSVPRGYTGPAVAPGAVQPVRVTVQVPADTAPGDYEGQLTIRAEGMEPAVVPVRIRVIGWTLPHPVDFTSIIGIVQSFETLALYYKVPLWSERHWQLIDRSFAILGRVGVDTIFLPLVMKSHFGKESLVRWIKEAGGGFSHDFSVFEKYVDTALKHMPRPQFACLYAYDRRYRTWEREDRQSTPARAEKLARLKEHGPPKVIVPLLDPKTGQVSEMEGPAYSDETAAAFWKPVLDGCRERLLKRGVAADAVIIGIVPDGQPGPETVDMFHEAAPWAKWMQVSHAPGSSFRGNKAGNVDVVHAAGVYGGTRRLRDPSEIRYYGWKPYNQRTPIFGVFPRVGAPYTMVEQTGIPAHWTFQEAYLMTGLRGPTRIGGEFWPVSLDGAPQEKKRPLASAYSSNIPGLGQAVLSLLEPGPDGALSTLRLETLYDGSQEGEARVFIEKAMEYHKEKLSIGGRTPEKTRAMLQDMLDERARMFLAYLPAQEFYPASGWLARSEKLYRAAADVAACLNR